MDFKALRRLRDQKIFKTGKGHKEPPTREEWWDKHINRPHGHKGNPKPKAMCGSRSDKPRKPQHVMGAGNRSQITAYNPVTRKHTTYFRERRIPELPKRQLVDKIVIHRRNAKRRIARRHRAGNYPNE